MHASMRKHARRLKIIKRTCSLIMVGLLIVEGERLVLGVPLLSEKVIHKSTLIFFSKKNGKTGIFFLAELLSKERDPKGEWKSLMERICPGVIHLILSGDTGNGYRAYEMLQELSNVFPKYGYSVELIPLGPGHAWNRTDARIAHLNTFFNNHKSKTRLYGAREYAKCLHDASDSTKATIRKLMHRSYVFLRPS